MKKTVLLLLSSIITLIFSTTGFCGDKATPKEVVAKVTEAVNLIAKKGEKAYPMIRDKNGPFVWKDTYVFVSTLDGRVLAAFDQKFEGQKLNDTQRTAGKTDYSNLLNNTKASPSGS